MRKANPAVIGAFVLGAIGLAVIGLVILGGGKFLRQRAAFVAYFDESMKGLSIGSPVTFNGVKVGTVTDISVVVDRDDVKIWTPVFFEVEARRLKDLSGRRLKFSKDGPPIELLIERGMRARLETQSLVTGQLVISLDFHPGSPIRLTGQSTHPPEMPTLPSSSARLARTLETLPIDQIAVSLQKSLEGVDKLINAPEVMETVRALKPTLAQLGRTLDETRDVLRDAQKLVRNVDTRLGPVLTNAEQTLARARTALESANDTLGSANDVISEDSALQYELRIALKQLSSAARTLRTLGDDLDRNPEALLSGRSVTGRK